MPFAAATVLTNIGKAAFCDRMKGTPSTYTNPFKYVAMGTGATAATRTAAITDTALSTETDSRTAGTESTVTTTTTGDTWQIQGTITAGGARAVDEMGLFDASTVGNMGFSATHAVVNLLSGDSIQYTAKTQLT